MTRHENPKATYMTNILHNRSSFATHLEVKISGRSLVTQLVVRGMKPGSAAASRLMRILLILNALILAPPSNSKAQDDTTFVILKLDSEVLESATPNTTSLGRVAAGAQIPVKGYDPRGYWIVPIGKDRSGYIPDDETVGEESPAAHRTRMAANPGLGLEAWADSLIGTEAWLRVDVVRLEINVLGGKDPTNIGPDGHAYYNAKLKGALRSTQTTTSEEFEAAVVQAFKEGETQTIAGGVHTWTLEKGSKVVLTDVALGASDIKIDMKQGKRGREAALRLKFDQDDYRIHNARQLFAAAFASTELELAATPTIELGMSVDEVLALNGAPTSRVNLGEKTILVYENMKMIFNSGKLSDVE